MVGLVPINYELYQSTHPTTFISTKLAHVGDNLDRYLMGRQFIVIFIAFAINLSGAPLGGSELWGLPKIVIDIFLGSGIAMILMTAMIGQLNSQVNASLCMLDYINNKFAVFTFYVAMMIEATGLMHASYLIQIIVAKLSGKPIISNEAPRNFGQNMLFWGRVLVSLGVLGFAFAVTLEALFNGQTTMWEGVHGAVAVVLLFLLIFLIGMLEGMQIAFFAVAKLPKEDRGQAKFAMKTCELLFLGKGHNLPGFMIGRQVCVTLCFFVVARVTTLNIVIGEDKNIFGVSDGLQNFFNTGLLGAVITTNLGSISWQLVASAFPLFFLSNPLVYVLLRICLFLESTGICSGAWVLAAIHKGMAGFKRDEEYIGTSEERAQKNLADDDDEVRLGLGHMMKLPVFAYGQVPRALEELMNQDPSIRDYLVSLSNHGTKKKDDEEKGLKNDVYKKNDTNE